MTNSGPLAGIRVLDLSRVLAGPFCGTVLADLGADVIKVEHPERGDDTRDWGMRIGRTETTYFNSVNRNKRSLTVNLKDALGCTVAREIAAVSDVLIENFKSGGAEKFGLGYEAVRDINPKLIYCSITGYDSHGRESSRLGYDLVVQGEAGLMAINGEPGQAPLKFGVAVVDLFTGMYAAQAIMAALIERHRTGKGRHVQLALFDCGLTLTCYYGLEALLSGEDPPRFGNAHPSIVPYGVFEAEDGPLVITVGTSAQFMEFCREVIRRPDIASDPRFATNILRSRNRGALLPQINAAIAQWKRQDLLTSLAAHGIPCGEVLKLGEALGSERATAGGMVTLQDHPEAGQIHVLAPAFRFDGERCPINRRPPLLGEHSEVVLREVLGKTPAQIQELMDTGAVGGK